MSEHAKERPTSDVFAVGDTVRYKPGYGTYGYEDCLEDDGRLPGVIVGFTRLRVRVLLTMKKRGPRATKLASVDAASLERAASIESAETTR